MSCECKCKVDGRKHNSDQKVDYVWNPAICSCENGKYLVLLDNSGIICDEIITSHGKTNFNGKKATCKMKDLYILLAFLLITVALMMAVSIYCYFIKYRAIHSICYHLTVQIAN